MATQTTQTSYLQKQFVYGHDERELTKSSTKYKRHANDIYNAMDKYRLLSEPTEKETRDFEMGIVNNLNSMANFAYSYFSNSLKPTSGKSAQKENNDDIKCTMKKSDLLFTGDKKCDIEIFIDDIPIFYELNIIDKPLFIEALFNLLWVLCKWYGLRTMRTKNMINYIVEQINIRTRENYAIINCKSGIDSYTCGRGMLFNVEPQKNTRIVIFNSVSSDDDNMDTDHYVDTVMPMLTGGKNNKKIQKYIYKLKHSTNPQNQIIYQNKINYYSINRI